MAEQLAGTATIRIRLQISPEDRAILGGGGGRIVGGAGGYASAASTGRGAAPGSTAVGGGGGAPGMTSRGGGILSSLKNAGMVAAAIALAQGTPGGAIATNAAAGAFDRAKSFSNDVMEQTGIGAWHRAGTRGQRATDALIAQLGPAAAQGAGATDEQIKLLYRMAEAMEALKDEGENRIRGVTGAVRLDDIGEKLLSVLSKIERFFGGSQAPTRVGIG